MASFRKLPSGNWQATVNTGQRDIYVHRDKRKSKTFPTLSEAKRWAARSERTCNGCAADRLAGEGA